MTASAPGESEERRGYFRAVIIIIAVLAVLCGGQSIYALSIGNRFLLKDALDWGYDVALWLVALACFGRGMRAEHVAAAFVALVLFVAGCHTAYDLWDKIATGRRPELWVAGWSSGTMVAYCGVLLGLLLQFRHSTNALIQATWLSSRNAIIITLCFAVMSLFARTQASQGYEIALDSLAIFLSFQACWAIFRTLKKDHEKAASGDGQGAAGRATSA